MPNLLQTNPQWILTSRQLCDLELIMNQGFAPLTGFMMKADYESVLQTMRLVNGQIWPMPIILDVTTEFANRISRDDLIDLCAPEGEVYAHLKVVDQWVPNKHLEANAVFGTEDKLHPGVNYLFNSVHPVYIGGEVIPVQLPKHYDFSALRFSPYQLKQQFKLKNWERVIGFQTRNPMHRAHLELTLRAAKQVSGKILLHPVVGLTKPHDIDHFTRVRCYQKLLTQFPENTAMLSLLPLAMRMAGPKEALWHALIRKNYGCSHFIVGRDHAGPGNDQHGRPFYLPYAAQELTLQHQEEIGINILPFQEMVYVKERKQYVAVNEVQPQDSVLTISGTQLRNLLRNNGTVPEWFSFPEIIKELHRTHPPRNQQGFTLFFTGLSGSGKSTLSKALCSRLLALGGRSVTILDGDLIRRHLSSELGFSRKDRDLNICRIGFVASEITKAGGIAICAAIAPYAQARQEARQLISEHGGFFEIYLDTPLSVCMKRDPKGLYAKSKQGMLQGLTGVDDPYEVPQHAELSINTEECEIDQAVDQIIGLLMREGFIESTAEIPVLESV